jgi:hypothetical protein
LYHRKTLIIAAPQEGGARNAIATRRNKLRGGREHTGSSCSFVAAGVQIG